jgi:hypothetical protein
MFHPVGEPPFHVGSATPDVELLMQTLGPVMDLTWVWIELVDAAQRDVLGTILCGGYQQGADPW